MTTRGRIRCSTYVSAKSPGRDRCSLAFTCFFNYPQQTRGADPRPLADEALAVADRLLRDYSEDFVHSRSSPPPGNSYGTSPSATSRRTAASKLRKPRPALRRHGEPTWPPLRPPRCCCGPTRTVQSVST